ncbi:ubiquinone/menaquinone biosynthesis C-methylase UbiE [Rhodobacter viridis]|uniref:Ubiquinone/menaquinone biosynthesis C-methylase UbiE n=1 Tax=Rhodobacter viridis TaxID=1054202 RepID=A0A318U490_9RHOB|nr:class I SAM-dependent methyltransferase [Rhodobacter viridis]PYF12829.1 ubiquinone/menaquinone biosynthesis C-methylase UbiE [Rhodobacter viridis]
MTDKIDFWNRVAGRYAARPVRDTAAYEAMLAEIAARLHPGDRVLEIGAGTGSTALRLGPSVALWLATDLSPEMHRIACAKPGSDRVQFRLAAAETCHAEAPFDAICAFHILHLVPDAGATLQALFAQLKPGGLFLSKTWCLADLPFWMKAILPLLRLRGWMPPARALKAPELRALITAAGFAIEGEMTFGKGRHSRYIVARKPG